MIVLPLPPSVNRYWIPAAGRGGLIISPAGREYKQRARWETKAQWRDEIIEPPATVSLMIRVYRPRKAGDLDNYLKLILDVLSGVVYADDSQVVFIAASRHEDRLHPRAEVEVGSWPTTADTKR